MVKLRSSWLLIPLSGVLLAAFGYLGGQASSPSVEPRAGTPIEHHAKSRPAVEDHRQLAALQQEVRTLRAANAALALQQQTAADAQRENLQAHAERAADEPDLPERDAEHGDAEQRAREEQARQERIRYFDELSRRVDTERIDGAWRHHTEAPLQQLLAQHLGPEISVAEATCASTYCRVKLSHPQSPLLRASTFSFDLARASLEVTEVSFDHREEGTTTLYFKRGPAPAAQLADAQQAR